MSNTRTKNQAMTTDPRAALIRAERVAKLLAEAVSEIGKMTETERDAFDLATSADPLTLDDLSAALETAATGLQRAADGLALGRATDETKRTAMASRAARRDLTDEQKARAVEAEKRGRG